MDRFEKWEGARSRKIINTGSSYEDKPILNIITTVE
jgi:hypothetical protein